MLDDMDDEILKVASADAAITEELFCKLKEDSSFGTNQSERSVSTFSLPRNLH